MGARSILLLAVCLRFSADAAVPASPGVFEIRVVDDQTGRGVPLVELTTVNHVKFVTDSAGRSAIEDPELLNRPVFFEVRSHGYEFPNDAFGFAGKRFTTTSGGQATLRIRRLNIAERLYRVTGEGIYRDSLRLGHPVPLTHPVHNGLVSGQDSVQAAIYRDALHWFWGDTSRLSYPLGQFRTSGATSKLPGRGGLDPETGVDLTYFTDAEGFSRQMCPLEKNEGPVWIDGLVVVPDATGNERLVAHYMRMKSLGERLEHGIVVYNDERQVFERAASLPNNEHWRHLQGHPVRGRDGGAGFLYCGGAFPTVRVPARFEAVLNPASYEVWTCLSSDGAADSAKDLPQRAENGRIEYAWRRDARPVAPADERRWLRTNLLKPEDARFQPVDVESGKRIQMHGGSVRWNEHRRRWVMIAVEQGGTSQLGEVWYSEADELTGPWRRARKVVTHEKYSFYNPVQHDFFDRDNGRFICFEGTYTHTFSGNPVATPRYDYNQIMYRLDLDDPRLKEVR